jgi:N-sulfoglucosamine sulfohydrolase
MLRLAEAGMTFTHAFAVSPSCAPSRAAFLTGLMPMRNGAMLNHQPPRAEVKKLPAYLQELGYEVVAFGKVAHYKQAKNYGFDQVSHDTFHDHEGVPAALQFLRDRKSTKPLCLMVGTNWPHVPWPDVEPDGAAESDVHLPPTHVDTLETRRWRRRYYAAIEKMDADLGQIHDGAYKYLGNNTLFIHFSDHGAQWPFGKWNLYEAGVHVPFIAVWPGVIKAKSESDSNISLVDVLPTLIDAAAGDPRFRVRLPRPIGIPLQPRAIDGHSRLKTLQGNQDFPSAYVYATHSGDGRMNEYPIRSVRWAEWKYIRNLKPDGQHHTHIDKGEAVDGNLYWASWLEKAKTDGKARAIVARYLERPDEELYDLAKDPYEQRNLAANPGVAVIRNWLSKRLNAWMDKQGDEGLVTEKTIAEAFGESN